MLVACLGLGVAGSAQAVPTSPSGGCPQPPNALIINEFSVGSGNAPRWVELYNPGKYALSLKGVLAVVQPIVGSKPSTKPEDIKQYDLGDLLAELPAGEAIAIGHVPPVTNSVNALLKTKVLDLGGTFALPCGAKLTVEGPNGLVDHVTWDLCGTKDYKGVWNLDPAQADICKNDDLKLWCQPPAELASLGTPGKANLTCDLDGDKYPSQAPAGAQADCDDLDKQIFPGAIEVCNGKDDDCNGQTDESLVAPAGTCLVKGVCGNPLPDGKPVAHCDGKGGFSCTYPYGYESVSETLCDGFDNDCDGLTDEGLTNACGGCGAVPVEACNALDDDCDGTTDDVGDLPQACTATGICAQAKTVCAAGKLGCEMPLGHEATETLCDGQDNDCDGQTDEELGKGLDCTKGTGICAAKGNLHCGTAGKVVCELFDPANVRKPETELCGDGKDNNCDGFTDEGYSVGDQCEAGTGACRVVGKKICSADKKKAICNVSPLPAGPFERCANQQDDDCDGATDETPCQTSDGGGGPCSATRAPVAAAGFGWLLALAAAALWVWRRRSA